MNYLGKTAAYIQNIEDWWTSSRQYKFDQAVYLDIKINLPTTLTVLLVLAAIVSSATITAIFLVIKTWVRRKLLKQVRLQAFEFKCRRARLERGARQYRGRRRRF
jgi:hypothetical protein